MASAEFYNYHQHVQGDFELFIYTILEVEDCVVNVFSMAVDKLATVRMVGKELTLC